MTAFADNITPIKRPSYPHEFSICTLVTRKEEYGEMLQSFFDAGFCKENCEFLYADNTDHNQFDAFSALNIFLNQARGKYIIICHQDILIDKDNYSDLLTRLEELNVIDPDWGICGNAGGVRPNQISYHISYPGGSTMTKGKFPLKVASLDENFLLVKNEANLKVTNKINGFHLYGTDLVLRAELDGYNAYVIAFNLTHKSRGNRDQDFFRIRKTLIKTYSHFFRPRWIQTNTTVFYLSGAILGRVIDNPVTLFFIRLWYGVKKLFTNEKA